MRDASFYVSGLLDLDKIEDLGQRRAIWRQSMATLARDTDGPGPLEGIQPAAILRAYRGALASGLVDDLDWLAPAAAAGALYELASALPVGPEQRELGRRVLARLLSANAEAFTLIATRMARASGKGMSTPPIRARIALVAELPINLQVPDGALALALASKRELARDWFVAPSTRSLPSRRLAARLLERAAREASRRAALGDVHAVRPFTQDALSSAWSRLLADRESLVWRHVAVARGLLLPYVASFRDVLEGAFAPSLSPTEWRRAAASAAALAAVAPAQAVRVCTGAQVGAVLEKDPGAAAAFVWGIARAAESEPDAASEILNHVTKKAPLEVAEALLELRAELGASPMIDRAAGVVLAALSRSARSEDKDDGAQAFRRAIARELEFAPREDVSLREELALAVLKFHSDGARAARAAANDVLEAARGALDALEAVTVEEDADEGRAGSLARRTSFAVLRDLDASLLEKNALVDLLRLGDTQAARNGDAVFDDMRDRLSRWILQRESEPIAVSVSRGAIARPSHPTLRLRRLRALLHLLDGAVGMLEDDPARAARVQLRLTDAVGALVRRFEADPPSVLRRTIVAALARAFDALLRSGACDLADVLLVVARKVEGAAEFETLAEASMDPDLEHVFLRYAAFLRATTTRMAIVADDVPPQSQAMSVADPRAVKLRALGELSRELAPDAGGRIESLRAVLERLHAAVVAVSGATSLQSFATEGGSEPDVLLSLESWLGSLTQLTSGAVARLASDRSSGPPPSATAARALSSAVTRALASEGKVGLDSETLGAAVSELLAGVPAGIARVCSGVLWGLADLPALRQEDEGIELHVAKRLPDWVPPRRTLGGFYVLRGLGAGNVGSVFVVTRYEDRHDPRGEKFALKVPEYSATAARSLSEAQFLDLFRSEASALLSVPAHPNLARFVTFDAGARPKPILVMEFVKGVSFDKVIRGGLDMNRCLRLLDDVLAGLSAMHAAGVGHLDLKPSNVVIRDGDQAVLVDFGLAGRHIRPGCGTGPYGAPEVWSGGDGTPVAADIYSFGCVAYEALTGRALFEAPNEVAQIALHVAHDGYPERLKQLAGSDMRYRPLVDLLGTTLRPNPALRPAASALRASLRALWPHPAPLPRPGPS